MKTTNLPASTWLLIVGAGIVLFIGAFAHFEPASSAHATAPAPIPPPLTEAKTPAEAVGEPTWPANLSPGLAEIIKLAQSHVDQGVILAYIKNSGQLYSPSAEEILYLKDLGLSQDVIAALFNGAPPAASPVSEETAAAAHAPPPAPLSAIQPSSVPAGPFHDELAPYGAWTQEPDYGLCWQPTVETVNSDWRPYFDAGQWLYSDSGWYWQSDYSWGWAVFHYGRWVDLPRRGWVWVPDNLWAPAWVAWRATPSYIGWAPLPPGVGLNVLAQLTYGGQPAGRNSSLGLAASSYAFVSTGNFLGRNLPRAAASPARAAALVQVTSIIDGYAIVNNSIVNGGINRDAVAVAARQAVPEVALRAVSSRAAAGLALDGKTLAVYLPANAGASPAIPALSGPLAVNKSAEATARLAENRGGNLAAEPLESDAEPIAQLPPLHYPASPAPPVARNRGPAGSSMSAPESQAANRGWRHQPQTSEVERPATPAPRIEGPPGSSAKSSLAPWRRIARPRLNRFAPPLPLPRRRRPPPRQNQAGDRCNHEHEQNRNCQRHCCRRAGGGCCCAAANDQGIAPGE